MIPAMSETIDVEEQTPVPLVTCFYCGFDLPRSEFSDEHIWPDALGGDYLPRFWRTDDVCARCNSMSGVYVDGAFIRGWAGSRERGHDARMYLSLTEPLKTVLPLDYLGKLTDPAIPSGDVADWWAGPCGATIVHFRPEETSDLWKRYLGGDPRAKKAASGRAYMALASNTEYWLLGAFGSFKKHFKRAKRYIVTPGLPPNWTAFEQISREDPAQAADLKIIDAMLRRARANQSTRARLEIDLTDVGQRWLCKLGLAIGCQIFGAGFGKHADGELLRRAFREANPEKRKQYKVRGSGYFTGGSGLAFLAWPAGWVLQLQVLDGTLGLAIVTPSGQTMTIAITDDHNLISQVPADINMGQAWIVVPSAARAVGPIGIADYVAHITRTVPHADLKALEAHRIDPSSLPTC